MTEPYRIAVLIPCYNEATAIATVIRDFRKALPEASIYVYDNNSTDNTAEIARENGAFVRHLPLRGKGNVVRRMFADVDADIYLLVDGDATYDASGAPLMITELVDKKLDVVIAGRMAEKTSFPAGHHFGNWLFNKIVHVLFGNGLKDIFSGYRVMSRRFVKSFPAHSEGFEIETEMSIYILEMRLPYAEIELPYYARPAGSQSKLNKYRDGLRILLTILSIFKHIRPLFFFNTIGLTFILLALWMAAPIIGHFLEYGTVPRLPTAVLCTGLALAGGLAVTCGFVLSGVARTSLEARHLRYLTFRSPYAE